MPIKAMYPNGECPDASPWLNVQLVGSPQEMVDDAFSIYNNLTHQFIASKITLEQFKRYVNDLGDELLDELRDHYSYEYSRW